MDGMQKQFKMHAETNALARSTGNVNGEVLRRMAQLEDVVRRDGRALQSVEQQLRVGLSQGAINGRHNAGGGGGDAGSGGSAAAAARSAAQATQVAAEAQDMLAELRATLRAKEAEDAQLQAHTKKQMQVLAVELQRASSDVNTLTVQLARTQDRLEQVAASSSPSGAGRNEPPAAQGGGDAVISQMAALNRHVNKQLAGMGEDIDMRLKVLEGRDAEAGSSAGPSELAAQVDDLSQALAALQTELQHERDSRKDAEASHMSVMVELRKALNEEKQHVGAKLGEVVSDLGRNLVEVREHGLERVNSARNTLDKQQRVVYRGLVSRRQPRCRTHARFVLCDPVQDRIEEESKAFTTIASRFAELEAQLRSESTARQEEAVATAQTTASVLQRLSAQLQEESAARAEAVSRLDRTLQAVKKESAESVQQLATITSRDRDMLAELVSTEIDARVKRDAQTVADLDRYVQGLAVGLKKVREACQTDTMEVRGEMEELQQMMVQRMAATAQKLLEQSSDRSKEVAEQHDKLTAQFNTVRESLQAAFREQTEHTDKSMTAFTSQVTKSFESLEGSLRRSSEDEWKARDDQRAELAATMERYEHVARGALGPYNSDSHSAVISAVTATPRRQLMPSPRCRVWLLRTERSSRLH